MNKSTKIIRVDVKRGANCRTPSTMSIAIEKADLSSVLEYMDAYEASENPTGKIRRIELVMYSEDDIEELEKTEELEKRIIELTEQLATVAEIEETIVEGVKTLEDVIIDQDAEVENINLDSLEHLNHQYNQGWISQEYYDKTKAELTEHLPPNQRYLDLYAEGHK